MEPVDPRIDPALVPPGSKPILVAEHQQDDFKVLPSVQTPDGTLITRWSLSDEERLRVLSGEDVFVTLANVDRTIHPMYVTIGPVNWNLEPE